MANPLITECLCYMESGHRSMPGWPEINTRLLSDECFSVVESNAGTRKRHCPHHDLNGKLDEEQLIYMTGTFNAIWHYIGID